MVGILPDGRLEWAAFATSPTPHQTGIPAGTPTRQLLDRHGDRRLDRAIDIAPACMNLDAVASASRRV
jgi:hypothetical protein